LRGDGREGAALLSDTKGEKRLTGHPIFCVECTVAIVEQTKIELSMVEQDVRWKG